MNISPNTILIDVRTPSEFKDGHIEGAISLPLDDIELGITTAVPDKATPMLLYCRSGARSGRACGIVMQMGYLAALNGGAMGPLAAYVGRRVVQR